MSYYNGEKLKDEDVSVLARLEEILGQPIKQGSSHYLDAIVIDNDKQDYNTDYILPSHLGGVRTSEPVAAFYNDGKKVLGLELDNFPAQKIHQCLEIIPEFKKTELLVLKNNGLTELPEAISYLKKLLKLDLSGNEQVTFPKSATEGLAKIEVLHLRDNGLVKLQEVVCRFSKLIHLNLANNQLQTLPEEMSYLDKLERLDLSENQLIALPDVIKELTKMEELNISENQLEHLPPFIHELSKLITLDISHNNLQDVPSTMTELSDLRVLKLHGNQFQRLDEHIWSFLAQLDQAPDKDLRLFPNPIEYNDYLKSYRNSEHQADQATTQFLEKYSDAILEEKDFERFVHREEDDYKLASILDDVNTASPPQLTFARNELQESHQEDLEIANLIAKALYGTFLGAGITKVIVGLEDVIIDMSAFFFSILFLLLFIHFFHYRATQKEILTQEINDRLMRHHLSLLNLQPADFEDRVDQNRRIEFSMLRRRFRNYMTFSANFFFSSAAIFLATISLTEGETISVIAQFLNQLSSDPLRILLAFTDYITTNIFELGIVSLFIIVLVIMLSLYWQHPRYREHKIRSYEQVKEHYWQQYEH